MYPNSATNGLRMFLKDFVESVYSFSPGSAAAIYIIKTEEMNFNFLLEKITNGKPNWLLNR